MVAKVPPAGITTYKGTPSAGDLGGGLHIKTADSGASVAANYDEIVIENSDHAGMSILTGTDKVGAIRFGDSGDNDIGGVLYNHDDNSMTFKVNAADKWKIDSTGNLIPGATTTGMYLGVSSATAANLLDDYEEGVWTPTVADQGSNVTISMNSSYNELAYTKVGNLVTFGGVLVVASTSGSWASGDSVTITLPFTSLDTNDQSAKVGSLIGTYNTNWTQGTSPYLQIPEGVSVGYCYCSTDNSTTGRVQVAGGSQIYFGGHFYAA